MADQTPSEKYRERVMKSAKQGESKYAKAKLANIKGGLTYLDCDASLLQKVAADVISDGAALLLAKTSDGGALVIRVVDDNESTAWYPASEQALDTALKEIMATANKP